MGRLLHSQLEKTDFLVADFERPFFLCMLLLSLSIMAMIIFVCGHRDRDYSRGTSGKRRSVHGGGCGGGGGGYGGRGDGCGCGGGHCGGGGCGGGGGGCGGGGGGCGGGGGGCGGGTT